MSTHSLAEKITALVVRKCSNSTLRRADKESAPAEVTVEVGTLRGEVRDSGRSFHATIRVELRAQDERTRTELEAALAADDAREDLQPHPVSVVTSCTCPHPQQGARSACWHVLKTAKDSADVLDTAGVGALLGLDAPVVSAYQERREERNERELLAQRLSPERSRTLEEDWQEANRAVPAPQAYQELLEAAGLVKGTR